MKNKAGAAEKSSCARLFWIGENMDSIDVKIISLLQKNARMSLKEIAPEVGLSSPAVASRIEKLERQGVILGYTASVDKQKLGYNITAFVSLEITASQKPQFYPFIEKFPNVLECCCVTGSYSMLIKVAFPTTQELDGFIGQLQHFGKTSTQIVFSTPVPHRELRIDPE